MNNQRDELAELLAKHEDCAFSASGVLVCSCGTAVQPNKVMDDLSNLAAHQADILTAAGFTRPRTVSTVAELDALPVGSVVLHNGRAFQHYPAHPAPFDEYQKWKCGDGGFVRSTKDGSAILPASVLYEPEGK